MNGVGWLLNAKLKIEECIMKYVSGAYYPESVLYTLSSLKDDIVGVGLLINFEPSQKFVQT